MNLVTEVIAWSGAGLAWMSAAYWLVTTALISKWRKEPLGEEADTLPPVTFFRPLKPNVRGLESELRRFLQELRPTDQVIFGVEQGSEEELLCKTLEVSGNVQITIVPCAQGTALNPKISKLIQMKPHARNACWIALDSEFISEPGWLDQFRTEWMRGGADAMTAGYRFKGAESLVQRLDVLPVLTTLWPGLAVIGCGGALKLMLGAVVAVRSDDMEQIGGLEVMGDFLADDNLLGVRLASAGKRVALSRLIAPLMADPLTWRAYWHHQRRIAVTYRACNPLGFAGSVCVQGLSFALLAFCLKPTSVLFGSMFLITLISRVWTIRAVARALSFPGRFSILETVVSCIVESACWVLAWLSPRVTWAGTRYSVMADGRLELIESH